jgi:hypothetical protein
MKQNNNKNNIKRTYFPVQITLCFLPVAVVSINVITDGSRRGEVKHTVQSHDAIFHNKEPAA